LRNWAYLGIFFKMKVFLTGATGYVGQRLVSGLLEDKIDIRALVRKQSINKFTNDVTNHIEIVIGDVTDIKSISGLLHECEAVIYVPGLLREFREKGITFQAIHVEGVQNLISEATRSGVKRFILISANGVRQNASTEYLKTKYDAEECLKQSNLNWTILRPSVIFGDEEKGCQNFISVIKDLLKIMPFFVPVIGNGEYRFQPISIQNLSEAVTRCIRLPKTGGKVFHLCGMEIFSYDELIDIISSLHGKKKIRLHLPVMMMRVISKVFDKYKWFPVSYDQITMLLEENICHGEIRIYEELGIRPIRLSEYYQSKNIQL
jgi:uncharacterized protein YbjT (DUF2867 family)